MPVNLLRATGVLIDLGEGVLHLRAVDTTCSMSFLSSGHPVISVTDFGEGWLLPDVCKDRRSESMFRTEQPAQEGDV